MSSRVFKAHCFLNSDRGQSLVEYTLVLSFISLLSVAVMSVLGGEVRHLYSGLMTGLALVRGTL